MYSQEAWTTEAEPPTLIENYSFTIQWLFIKIEITFTELSLKYHIKKRIIEKLIFQSIFTSVETLFFIIMPLSGPYKMGVLHNGCFKI